jgi:anti-anti-sigma factor
MAIVTHKDIGNNIRVIAVTERLDLSGTEKIEPAFINLVNSGSKRIVVDISDVTFLSSIGIRMLIANAKLLQAAGGRMVLTVGFNAAAIRTLKMVCVDSIIPMFETQAAAEAALGD